MACNSKIDSLLVKSTQLVKSTESAAHRSKKRFMRSLIEGQCQELPPDSREKYRRAALHKAFARMAYESASKVTPNMFFEGTQASITKAADSISTRMDDPNISSFLMNADTLCKKLIESADNMTEVARSASQFFAVPDLARFGTIAATTIAQLLMSKSYSIIFVLLEIVKICAYLIPSSCSSQLESLKSFVMSSFSNVSNKFKKPSTGTQQQAQNAGPATANSGIESNVPSCMTKFVHKTVGLLTGTKEEDVRKFGALKSLGDMGRSLHNLNMGATTIMKWITWIFDSMHELTSRLLGNVILTGQEDALKINTGFCELLNVKPEDFGKKDYAERLQKLYEQSISMKYNIENKKVKLNKVSTLIVTKNIDKIITHYKENRTGIMSVLSSQKARKTPYFFQLVGTPGGGKSTLMTAIAKIMTQEANCGKIYPKDDLIFNVSKTAYKDGYRMQPVHIDDDQWQSKSGDIGNENEYMNTITNISCTNFQVNMANLDDKGMPYACDLYIGSTNNPYPRPDDISDHKALWRRRNKLVQVISRDWKKDQPIYDVNYGEEYSQLNFYAFRFLKTTETETWGNYDTEAKRILREKPEVNPGLPDWINFRDMIKELCRDYKRHLVESDPKWINGDNLPTILSNVFAEDESSAPQAGPSTANFGVAQEHEFWGRPDLLVPLDGDIYNEEELEYFADYPGFIEQRAQHIPAGCYCNNVEACHGHAAVCCVPSYVCSGLGGYVRHFCGKFGFYADLDEMGFLTTTSLEDADNEEVGWLGLLQANCIQLPAEFEPMIHPAGPVYPDMGYELPWLRYVKDKDGKVTIHERKIKTPDVELGTMTDDDPSDLLTAMMEAINEENNAAYNAKVVKRCIMILSACAAIGTLVWMFRLYKPKNKREKTPTEKVGKVLSKVLDELEDIDEVPQEMKEDVTKLMIKAQEVVANGSYYVSDVPNKGPGARYLKASTLRATANSGISSMDERIRRMEDNLLKCRASGNRVISALGLYDKNVIINQHFLDNCDFDEEHLEFVFDIYRYNVWKQIRVSLEKVFCFQGRDMAIFQLPKGHCNFRDVRKYFAADSNWSLQGGHMSMVGRRTDGSIARYDSGYRPRSKLGYNSYSHPIAWQYVVSSDLQGMCGSPIWDTHLCSIIGLHVASGDDVDGEKYAMPVAQSNIEEITKICDKLWVKPIQDETIEAAAEVVASNGGGTVHVDDGIEKIGSATAEASQHTVGKTKIVKSPIFGVFENHHEPAVLSMNDKRISEEARKGQTIHEKGINKYATPTVPWKARHIARARGAILGKLEFQKNRTKQRLLTEFEVLNGLVDGSLKAIDMDASAGFPWMKRKPSGVKGKQNIFMNVAKEGDRKIWEWADTEQAAEVKARYEHMESEMRKGKNVFWLAYSNIKDELRSHEKVKDANSRSFDCVPIEVTLLFRKYFGTMIAQMHLNCADSPISVGIDPFTQWTKLAHRMLRRGNALIAGDYKNWDGSVSAEELADAVSCVNNFYDDEDEEWTVRELLIYGSTHMWCAVSDTIIRKHQGLPSGIPPTAVLNSFINWMRLLCVIQEIWEDSGRKPLTPDDLNNDVDLLLYGDDHVISLTPELRDVITFRTVRDAFTKHGITYTDSRKTGAEFDFETLEDLTYLKRTFKEYIFGFYIAPLDIKSVLRQANWIHKNKRVGPLDMLACIKNSLQEELALHGREIYNKAKKDYNDALIKVAHMHLPPDNSPYIITDYELAEYKIRERLGLAKLHPNTEFVFNKSARFIRTF